MEPRIELASEHTSYDVSKLRRLDAYIAQLPEGLDSFPECLAKASVVRKVYEFSELPLTGLPEPLQAVLDNPPPSSAWLPQVHVLALVVAMVEARELPPAREAAWIRDAATHLFASPMYRILMWAATPRLVFKSANVRWSAFFKGSHLSSDVEEHSAVVQLHAPRALFHEDLAKIFEHVIYAAVNYTKDDAAAAGLRLSRFDAEQHAYDGYW